MSLVDVNELNYGNIICCCDLVDCIEMDNAFIDEIKEIELDSNGNVNTVSNAITLQNIVSLQCNIQNSLFVIFKY